MFSSFTFAFVVGGTTCPTAGAHHSSRSRGHYPQPLPKAERPNLRVCTSEVSSPVDSASDANKQQNPCVPGETWVKVDRLSGSVQLTCPVVGGCSPS